MLIDTHSHLFLPEFDQDRKESMERAIAAGVEKIILPNVDASTLDALRQMTKDYPEHCYPLWGLHPGSVKENYKDELAIVRECLETEMCYGVGEIGLDFYWDKRFTKEQTEAFDTQIKWAAEKDLPIVIHLRESYNEVIEIIKSNLQLGIRGIFHCFTGNVEQANEITDMGFLLGIGGIVTFKNSGLDKTLSALKPEHLVIETDSPYLAPTPYRGKRNESAYARIIAQKIANIYQISLEKVEQISTQNAIQVFGLSH
jgi:TatD DNase family protein